MRSNQGRYLIAAAFTGVLLYGGVTLNGDAGLSPSGNIITVFDQPADWSSQTLNQSQSVKPGEAPYGLPKGAWTSIQTQIAAGRYNAHQHGNGGFVSSNPAHGWQIRYATDGSTTLKPRDRQAQAYQIGLTLSAVGYTEPQALDHPEQVSADEFTVTYQWNDYLREWWVNSATGLEQWFEIAHRPPGAPGGQPLILEMKLATGLAASQNGNALSFTDASGTAISYNKLKAWDANGRDLPARMQLAAAKLSLIVDDTGANYPLTIDPSFEQQAYIKASNTDAGDWFGGTVAIYGDTLVVSAAWEASNATGINGDQANNTAQDSGAVYVFIRNGTVWSQQAYIKASNTDVDDFFGVSIAIYGDTLAVGTFYEDSSATGINGNQSDNSANAAGAVYVFTRSGTVWSQQAYVKASNTDVEDRFGTSVAIYGDTLVVGARDESSTATGINGDQGNNSAQHAGAAYVFTRSGTVWSQQAYLKASNTDSYDQFGSSVAIYGDTVVVGAVNENSNATGINGDQGNNSAINSGAAYVFTRSGGTWSQQAYLKASNTGAGDAFGYSIAIAGDTVVVSAIEEDSNVIGINGNQSDNSADAAGAAYVFTRSGTVWSQQAYVKASNTDVTDRFGSSVSIYGDMLAVGTFYEDSSATGINGNQFDNSADFAGAAYVFTRSDTVWSQQAYVKASNTDVADFFGNSVAIYDNVLVVGARDESSNATGINGDQDNNSAQDAGAVYVFSDIANTHFTINPGLNDAWFNLATDGQGFLITVFPDRKEMFLAWFTYDTERPPEEVTAMLGEPGHRWLTAQGTYQGDTANLTIYVTEGGVFDAAEPVAETDPAGDGTMTLEFADCTEGLVNYEITSLGISGEIPIQRITPDNVPLCEALNSN
jgi:hypothetical protein